MYLQKSEWCNINENTKCNYDRKPEIEKVGK